MPGPPAKSYRLLLRLALPFVELGEERARAALTALRFSNVETRRIAEFARAWTKSSRPILDSVSSDAPIPDVTIRRWVAEIGRLDIGPFMRIVAALSKEGSYDIGARLRALYRRMIRVTLRDPIAIADLAIDGDDMRIAGIPAGPWVGKILKALLDVVLTDPARNDRDWLLQEARRLYTP
jgi:hypothetical protein